MKKQHLLILAGALVVLLGVRLLMSAGGGQVVGDLESAGLSRIVGADFGADEVTGLRLRGPSAGDASPTELALSRADDGWTVDSAHGAPAEPEPVSEFLDRLATARGELRGEGEGLYEEFGVTDAGAARLVVVSGGEELTLLLGKEGDTPEAHFVRVAGSDRIHHVAKGLRGALGLRGADAQPAGDHWVDKQVLDLEADQVARIEVARPDADWAFEHRLAAPAVAEGESGETAPPVEREWVVEAPGLDYPATTWGPSGVASRMVRLRVNSVLDPASAQCQLDASAPTVRLRTDSDEEHVVRLGTMVTADDEVPLRLQGRGGCYGLAKWTARSLLPRAGQIFEAPKPFGDEPPEAEAFTEIDIARTDGTAPLRLSRDDEGWSFVAGGEGEARGARVDRIVSGLRFLAWDDLVTEARVPADRLEPFATVTARAGEATLRVEFLGERAASTAGDRYVRITGGEGLPAGWIGTVADSSVSSLLPEAGELLPDEDDAS